MKRSAFAAAGAAFVAAPAIVRAQSLTKLRIAATTSGDIIGALWGAQSGIFQKYGLDVTVQQLNSGAAVSAGVIGGSIDIGKSNVLFGLVLAHARACRSC